MYVKAYPLKYTIPNVVCFIYHCACSNNLIPNFSKILKQYLLIVVISITLCKSLNEKVTAIRVSESVQRQLWFIIN